MATARLMRGQAAMAGSFGKPGRLGLFLAVMMCAGMAAAQSTLTFPALSGRVVDAANIIAPERRAGIEAKLAAHEGKTSDQLVVATVPSLQGTSIEDYANRLFREWKLGEARSSNGPSNNGALLLVAPNERKVRIEVGYGLEGALTDALSKVIITTAITPRFKTGDFAGGIEAGVDAMLSILTKDADEWQRRAKVREDQPDIEALIPFIIMAIFVAIFLTAAINGARRGRSGARLHRTRNGKWIALPDTGINWGGASSGGSGWGGGSSGGGFSGGGGSSGGGGASGDW